MFSKINSMGIFGMDSFMVEVEADSNLRSEMPSFNIVGLPDTAVKESRDRVRAAIKNCKLNFPPSKIVVNLAPADVKKEGAIYDLPMLIAILSSLGQLDTQLDDCAFIGELSLDGSIRPVDGMLSMTICAKEHGIKRLFVPAQNAAECSVVDGIDIYPTSHVLGLLNHLTGEKEIEKATPINFQEIDYGYMPDFSEVKGQHAAKKALEIAAAGGHNVLIIGHIYLLSKNEPRCA